MSPSPAPAKGQAPASVDTAAGPTVALRRRALGSIRAQLMVSLFAALALTAALVGGMTYRNVLTETEALFDYQLRQMALSLRDQDEVAPGDAAALNDEGLDFVVQIWRVDGRSVYASRAHRSLPSGAVMGLSEVKVDGERWRSFAVAARDRVIQVAQPVRIRQGLAADAALRAVLPLAIAAPLIAGLLWWLIAHALRPLAKVARQVSAQDTAALSPLPTAQLPDEVAPLVAALNALLARLGEAWGQQRAFVADAAHELRSPLTALKLQAQVLHRLSLSDASGQPERGAALDALVTGVDRASRLVEQLLGAARSEPGAPAPTLQAVVLAPLLRQVLAESAAPLAAARGSQIELDADESLQGLADAAELALLVRNLVDNALRYSPTGAQVRLTLAEAPGGPLLTVDDSGAGIAPAERETVFERFVRGAGAQHAAGSGLGLAIVRAIARRHGATVTLGESPMGGLRVSVQLQSAHPHASPG